MVNILVKDISDNKKYDDFMVCCVLSEESKIFFINLKSEVLYGVLSSNLVRVDSSFELSFNC